MTHPLFKKHGRGKNSYVVDKKGNINYHKGKPDYVIKHGSSTADSAHTLSEARSIMAEYKKQHAAGGQDTERWYIVHYDENGKNLGEVK